MCAWRASGDERNGGGGDVSRAREREDARESAASEAMAGAPRICIYDMRISTTIVTLPPELATDLHGLDCIVRILDGVHLYKFDDVRKEKLVDDFDVVAIRAD